MTRMGFLGRGLSFPVSPSFLTRELMLAEGPEKVRQAIFLILETEPGERLMRPTYGCGLRRYLMKPNTVATRALIQREVELALKKWEPRIELNEVRVERGADPAEILISIDYLHTRDRSQGSLVYPFYLGQ